MKGKDVNQHNVFILKHSNLMKDYQALVEILTGSEIDLTVSSKLILKLGEIIQTYNELSLSNSPSLSSLREQFFGFAEQVFKVIGPSGDEKSLRTVARIMLNYDPFIVENSSGSHPLSKKTTLLSEYANRKRLKF